MPIDPMDGLAVHFSQMWERGLRSHAADPFPIPGEIPRTASDFVLDRASSLDIHPVHDSIGAWGVYVGDEIISPLFVGTDAHIAAQNWLHAAIIWRRAVWVEQDKAKGD